MKPKRYGSLSHAADDIKVMYGHKNKRSLITRRTDGAEVFYIKWLED